MPIQPNGPAPYAPPSAFLGFMEAVRDKDLPTPYTTDVLVRAGVSDTLSARVLKTLKLLDLVDDENQPTDQLHDLAKAGGSEYKTRFADVLRAAYADVFQYIDPSRDPVEKIQDQFRHYTPRGQRERMVTLFLGLCEFTDMAPPREREAKPHSKPGSKTKAKEKKAPKAKKAPSRSTPQEQDQVEFTPSPAPSSGQHPLIRGLIQSLPESGSEWPQRARNAWVKAALANFELVYDLPPEDRNGGDPSP